MKSGLLGNQIVGDFLRSKASCPYAGLGLTFVRHESAYRRTRKRLRVKPEASFLTSQDGPQQDHIIFHPPSSAPSIYHTPLKFLPKDDSRRELMTLTHKESFSQSTKTRLPPALDKPYEKRYHLTEADIAEIRRLATEKSAVWSPSKLAEKFRCSKFFITIVCRAGNVSNDEKRRERHLRSVELATSRWGRKRRVAREDRTKRKELWGQDE